MSQNDAGANMRKIVALVIKSYAYACSCCHNFALLDKSEVEGEFASASERNSEPRGAVYGSPVVEPRKGRNPG